MLSRVQLSCRKQTRRLVETGGLWPHAAVLGKPLRPGAGAGGAWRAGGSPPALPGPCEATEAAAAGSPPRASSRPPHRTPPLAFCREPSAERDTPTLRRVYLRPRKCQKTGFRGRTHRGTLPSGPRRGCWGRCGRGPWAAPWNKNRPAPDDGTASRRLSPAGHPVRNALPLYSHVAGSFKTLWHQLNFC